MHYGRIACVFLKATQLFQGVCDIFRRRGALVGAQYLYWRMKYKIFNLLLIDNAWCFYNIKLRTDYKDKTFKFYFLGSYGTFYSDYLASINFPFVFVDVGANQGLYAILAAKNALCERVVCFEPIAATCCRLGQNIELNGVGHKCDIVESAISSRKGNAFMSFDSSHSGKACLQTDALEGRFKEAVTMIDRNELSRIFAAHTLPVVLKVDVEGFEEIVLQEIFSSIIRNSIISVFYEIDERRVDKVAIENLLRSFGFIKFVNLKEGSQHFDVFASKS